MSRRVRAVALFVAALALTTRSAGAQSLPKLTEPVNDLANVLDADRARDLDLRIRALEKASGDVVIVATVPTLAPYGSIEDYAVALFAQAGVGQHRKDNGLLIVLALKERRVRIEVGYGLEDIVTDGFSGDTIRQQMLPEFRAGHYGAGLAAGATAVIQRITARRGVTLESAAPAAGDGAADDASIGLGVVLFLLICGGVLAVLLFGISRLARATGGARTTPAPTSGLGGGTWSGWQGGTGSFGGGGGGDSSFSGFGGGSSGGGGASGSW